jgi:hypothetical protein
MTGFAQPAFGENKMKFRSILFCSAAVFLASAPAWADRIDIGDAQRADSREISINYSDHSDHVLSTSQNERFDVSTVFKLSDSNVSTALDFHGTSDWMASGGGEPRWSASKKSGNGNKGTNSIVLTPEPGSFLLLLFGVGALGVFAYSREAAAKPTRLVIGL